MQQRRIPVPLRCGHAYSRKASRGATEHFLPRERKCDLRVTCVRLGQGGDLVKAASSCNNINTLFILGTFSLRLCPRPRAWPQPCALGKRVPRRHGHWPQHKRPTRHSRAAPKRRAARAAECTRGLRRRTAAAAPRLEVERGQRAGLQQGQRAGLQQGQRRWRQQRAQRRPGPRARRRRSKKERRLLRAAPAPAAAAALLTATEPAPPPSPHALRGAEVEGRRRWLAVRLPRGSDPT